MKANDKQLKNVDMQFIADEAGVARSTVSRALNNSPLVNEKTKARIHELARQYNYQINEAARNLRLQDSSIISVVMMTDPFDQSRSFDPFFMEMISALAVSLSRAEFDMLLCHSPPENADSFYSDRMFKLAKGFIFIGQGRSNALLNRLFHESKPMVVWGAEEPTAEYPLVTSDDIEGGYIATKHLLDMGYYNIVFFGDDISVDSQLRYKGFLRAIKEQNIDSNETKVPVPYTASKATEIIAAYLANNPQIDGIVCSSDLIALSTVACLKKLNKNVPDDVAVVGYDGLTIAERASPSLTTVDQQIAQRAEDLVALLQLQMHEKKSSKIQSIPKLLVRESTVGFVENIEQK